MEVGTARPNCKILGIKPKFKKLPAIPMTLEANNQKVGQVSSFEYLGIIIDESINFVEHTDYVYNKSCKKLGAIKKCRKFLNTKISLMLYKSLAVPLMDYCDTVYMQANQDNLDKLQIVQNMACRIILETGPRYHISDMHKELQLELQSDRRKHHLLSECHKNIHTDKVLPLQKYFILNKESTNRRTRRVCKFDVLVPRLRTSAGQKAFSYVGPSAWNKLKAELKEIVKLKNFKDKLKKSCNSLDNHPT